jgi:hypothetical protein
MKRIITFTIILAALAACTTPKSSPDHNALELNLEKSKQGDKK